MEVGQRLDERVPLRSPCPARPGPGRSRATEPGQGGPEPVLERAPVAAPAGERPADQQVDGHRRSRRAARSSGEDRLVRAGRLAIDVAAGSSASANSTVASRASLRLEWPWPRLIASRARSPSCQLSPRSPTPAVDLGLDVDGEHRLSQLGPFVRDPEPLDVLARRFLLPGVPGQAIAHRHEIGDQDPDRPVPPGQLGRQQVGDARVVLERLPGGPLGEPVEPPPDRQAADDRPEVRPALRQVSLLRADVGVEADGREVDVVGRAPAVDPDGHHPVADQALGRRRPAGPDDSVRSGRLGRTIVSW